MRVRESDACREKPENDDAVTREPVHPRRPGDRAALVGFRQLGNPLPGLPHPRHAPRSIREDRGCRAGAPSHGARTERRAAHPLGRGRGLRCPAPPRRRPRRAPGHRQLEHLPGRGLQVRRADAPRRTHPPQGDRPSPRVHRHHGCHGLARPEDLAGRRIQLPRPERHAGPTGSPPRLAAADLRTPGRRAAPRVGVQVLRAGVLPHRRSRLGHLLRAGGGPGREGDGLPRHRPPCPRHQHRVHRHAVAATRTTRLLRLQQPLLRRRRPHRRGGRPFSSCSASSWRSSAAAV